jgi:hypothetical protein
MVHAFGDWQQDWMAACDAWMGRRLWSFFNRSGLFRGRVHTYVLANTDYRPPYYGYARIQDFAGLAKHGLITPEELEKFYRDIQEQADRGAYFYSITLYVFVGQKVAA